MLSVDRYNISNWIYPQIKTVENNDINQKIIKHINKQISEDILCFKDIVQSDSEVIDDSYSDYKISLNNDKIISIYIEFSQLSGLYDIKYINTYNYDIRENNQIYLSDIFDSNTDYLQKINVDVQNKIKQIKKNLKKVENDMKFRGYKSSVEIYEDQVFYIEEDKIVICFSSYELGSSFPYSLQIKLLFKNYKNYLSKYTLKNICKDIDI